MEIIRNFLEFKLISIGDYTLRVYSLAIIVLIFLLIKIILWLIKKTLFRKHNMNRSELGNTYALFQIIKSLASESF
jgi:hypothetical protein